MNFKSLIAGFGTGLLLVCGLLFAGCSSMPSASDNTASQLSDGAKTNKMETADQGGDFLRPGQKITVEFSDVPGGLGPITQTVREDGMIGLPLGIDIKAAGLNRGDLIEAIHKAYVPAYYKRMSVNVKSDELYYSVGGEVKSPSQRPYLGQTTVLQAIQSAGDFTDFAQRKKIQVTRANGKKYTVNWFKAAQDRSLDIPVYPGDRIIVPRRRF